MDVEEVNVKEPLNSQQERSAGVKCQFPAVCIAYTHTLSLSLSLTEPRTANRTGQVAVSMEPARTEPD